MLASPIPDPEDTDGPPVLDRSRDTLGRDTGFQLLDGTTVENQATYPYSATEGRFAGVASPAGTFQYSYIEHSDLVQTVAGPAHAVINHWEAKRDALDWKENKAGQTVISRYGYAVNGIGQRTGVATSGTAFQSQPAGWDWGYDALGQVVSGDSPAAAFGRAYRYDRTGNRTRTAQGTLDLPTAANYTANALNQYTKAEGVTLPAPPAPAPYDPDGNLRFDGGVNKDNQPRQYLRDAEWRPAAVADMDHPQGGPQGCRAVGRPGSQNRLAGARVADGATLATCAHDAFGRRVSRTAGTSTSLFLYDGWNVVAEYASTSTSFEARTLHTWGPDLSGSLQTPSLRSRNRPFASVLAKGAKSKFLADIIVFSRSIFSTSYLIRNTAMKEQSWGKILTALFIAFATTASAVPIGVTVNSVHLNDDASITDPNWTYNSQTGVLTFHGSGNFMVSGTNTAGKARIVIPNGVTNTVRIWNLNLQAPGDGQCIFALGTNACVSLILKGTNTLASGQNRAGIEVPKGASLSITSAAADEADMLTATGGQYGAGIGGGNGVDGGTVIINSSIVTATGGGGSAGIGGGSGGKGGTLTINDGVVTATGGSNSAGIGGGNGGDGGTLTINGGRVTATGGSNSAGIGGGNGGDGGTLTINGGRVAATGGDGSAGVGGGKGGTVTISGGSLFAQGKNGGADIGQGSNGTVSGANTFTGGAIHLANNSISVAPTDGSQRVWCMTATNLTPHAVIVVTGLDPYGMNDLVADNAGKLRLWLPNGSYTFTAGGAYYAATIDSADTTATLSALTPPDSDAYITFSSANTFEVKPKQGKSWNGILYYSTDKMFWSIFTTDGATSATDGAGEHKLYLCGSGNSYITGNPDGPPWSITATAPVTCSGNLETLLDHAQVNAGEHPAMAPYCFSYLFKGCASLVSAPSLPATNLTNHCYYNLFNSCTGLTNAPALPATTLPERCYNGMFNGCTNLTQAPALPATTLGKSSYGYMFYKCTGLTSAPELPATTLAVSCYDRMFFDCTGLTSAPELPAMKLAERCYEYMFRGCTGLTEAPVLPATNLFEYCYANMFNRCTGLTTSPALPATALAERCYNGMFTSCTGLTNVPTLPATTLAPYCYYYMFQSCTGLTSLPTLPATNLADSCYGNMFYKCSGIELNTDAPGMPWSIPNDAIATNNWNVNMFEGTGGTFQNGPEIGTKYYLVSGLPDAPAFPTDGSALVFDGTMLAIKIVNAQIGVWYTLYEADTPSGPWAVARNVCAEANGDLVFTNLDTTTAPRRFFRVAASFTAP